MPVNRGRGRWWEPRSGSTELQVTRDASLFSEAADQARRDSIQEIQALSDNTRTILAQAAGLPLSEYDDALEDELWDILDRLDYYGYSNRTESVNVKDGAWFTPIAVESVSSEDILSPPNNRLAIFSIDGLNSTGWRTSINERHSITYLLRDYPKKISKMRIRSTGSPATRQQLINIDVSASRGLGAIDNPQNLLLENFTPSPTWPGGGVWFEIDFTSKKNNARYIKLSMDTEHPDNQLELREIAFWVETKNLGDDNGGT